MRSKWGLRILIMETYPILFCLVIFDSWVKSILLISNVQRRKNKCETVYVDELLFITKMLSQLIIMPGQYKTLLRSGNQLSAFIFPTTLQIISFSSHH